MKKKGTKKTGKQNWVDVYDATWLVLGVVEGSSMKETVEGVFPELALRLNT